MNMDMAITLTTLAFTLVLFASDKLRLDVVAMLALLVLLVGGVLTPAEALAGFAAPVVILIAALFIVSEGISATGLAARFSRRLGMLTGTSEPRMVAVLMIATATMSAFMSSTGAVALMLPIALRLCDQSRIAPSKVLIPIAFAASLGGMLTLIGTPPNLVVSRALGDAGHETFEFFEFTPVGLVMLGAGILFMVVIGRRILPAHERDVQEGVSRAAAVSSTQVLRDFELEENIHWLRVRERSDLVGVTIGEAAIATRHGVTILDIRERETLDHESSQPVSATTRFFPNAVLVVRGTKDAIQRFATAEALDLLPAGVEPGNLVSESVGFTEVLILPRSPLIGRTLAEARFWDLYGVYVIGIHRAGQKVGDPIGGVKLAAGDTLLVRGAWKAISLLADRGHDFLVTGVPRELEERRLAEVGRRAPAAAAILLAMVVVMCLGVTAPVTVALAAALIMVLARCVSPERIYRAVNWQSVVLIAAMLPMATALEKSGATKHIVAGLVSSLGELGPYAVMAGFFLLTSLMSLVVSNTATTVIIAPVAIRVGTETGAAPAALMMIVAVAASCAFATPMASPINALVMGPGGYKFKDYLATGLPLQLVILILSLAIVPLMFGGG